jgi:hypothetical protein
MRLILIGLLIALVHSAKAAVCCPTADCVPLNDGSLTCVKAGTNQRCVNGSICGGGSGGGGGGGGGQSGSTEAPIVSPPACGLWAQCRYANGVVSVSIQGSEVRYNGPPPTEQVLGYLVYSDPKACVGAVTPPLKLPVTGQEQKVNLYTLDYVNCGSASPPMSFRASMGPRPTLGSRSNLTPYCGCTVSLPAPPNGPNTCREGFVWRAAFPGDAVCVTPARQAAVQAENQQAAANRAGGGAFGPNTCKSGFVWRAAGPSDNVCVTVQSRGLVQQENANQWARVAHIAGQ